MTNVCAYDCQYCVNRRSNDVPRAAFTPRELAELTIQFYRRNYIEGLFLSSAVSGNPDCTTERMMEALRILREEYGFAGYIHAKAIPGADPLLTYRLGLLADRLSVNIELPSEQSLNRLAPDKARSAILAPMGQIRDGIRLSRQELAKYRHAPRFAPAGQSTQMIVGATPESDLHILRLTEGLYRKYQLKRVFYSAYVPVSDSALLPARQEFKPPLLREHRLYQATGCCATTTSAPPSCWTRPIRTLIPAWTPSAPGRCGIWSAFPWRSTGPIMRPSCGCPASAYAAPSASSPPAAAEGSPLPGSRPWGWCSSAPNTFSPAPGGCWRACG